MTETFSTPGLKALFSYPFRHPGWENKLLILALLCAAGMLIPILPWLPALGYMAEILRRAAAGDGNPDLPEWDDWGRMIKDGLRLGGTGLLAMLPLILVFGCGFSSYFVSMIGAIASESAYEGAGGMPLGMLAGMLILCLTMGCGLVLSLVVALPLPAVLAHVALKRSFSAAFQVKEWGRIFRANLGGFLIGVGLLWAVGFAIQFIVNLLVSTVVLCVAALIAPLVITPYLMVISGLLYGRIYYEGVQNLNISAAAVITESPAI